jgi:MFS family permease
VPTARNGWRTGTKDYPLLLAARVMRAFGFGFIAVLVSVYLSNGGRSAAEIGLLLGIALAASAMVGLVFAAASRRIGRRSCLAIAGLLMAVSGLALAAGSNSWWPFLAAATGMMGASNIDAGPFAGVAVPPQGSDTGLPQHGAASANPRSLIGIRDLWGADAVTR